MCRGLRLPPQAAFKTRILHFSTSRWDWAVEARDVEFSATFLAADAEAVLVVAARLHAAAAGPVEGRFCAPAAGVLRLQWSNAHSYVRKKTLSFRVTPATDPDRGLVFCSRCNKEQLSNGRKTIVCGVCLSSKVKVTKEAAGKYA